MDHASLILLLAVALGLFMAWGIGANDVANAMGTSVGSKALTLRQAVIIAAIFEAAGALLAGGEVTDTIRGKIINLDSASLDNQLLMIGMLAALAAAATWLLIASHRGWPVSTTHSIVGAIIGFSWLVFGPAAVHWPVVINILLSWITTPVISGIIAYGLFKSIQHFILSKPAPLHHARQLLPLYLFFVGFVVANVTLLKGLKHLGWQLPFATAAGFSATFGAVCTLAGYTALRQLPTCEDVDLAQQQNQLQTIFARLMIFTASAMAFAHGSNDVANAIGPLAAIVGILKNPNAIMMKSTIPSWVLLLGASGIVLGLATYGYRVIETIGNHITELTPSQGFCAEIATATTVVIASATGMPISTTHTLVGAVLGIGIARHISALNLPIIRNIFLSWIITLPVSAILAIVFYQLLHWGLSWLS